LARARMASDVDSTLLFSNLMRSSTDTLTEWPISCLICRRRWNMAKAVSMDGPLP
jgi:hypothetical protein